MKLTKIVIKDTRSQGRNWDSNRNISEQTWCHGLFSFVYIELESSHTPASVWVSKRTEGGLKKNINFSDKGDLASALSRLFVFAGMNKYVIFRQRVWRVNVCFTSKHLVHGLFKWQCYSRILKAIIAVSFNQSSLLQSLMCRWDFATDNF
jgi:hypothetical protein